MKPKGIFLLTLCISVFLVLLLVLKNMNKSGSHKEDEGSGNHEDHALTGTNHDKLYNLGRCTPN